MNSLLRLDEGKNSLALVNSTIIEDNDGVRAGVGIHLLEENLNGVDPLTDAEKSILLVFPSTATQNGQSIS